MEHVLDIYKLPYDEEFQVVCMDESPKQLIEQVASTPMRQGQEAGFYLCFS
ncbi:MAG: Mobile element protein, partial [Ignavibacteria bacterium]|nr:Mobile element protein [Ignavibacteria bacterium]